MNKIIQLTTTENNPIYMNIAHIESFYTLYDYTTIHTITQDCYHVKETPEEIMAAINATNYVTTNDAMVLAGCHPVKEDTHENIR